MSLDETLNEAMESVPECIACGYMDLGTGMLLGHQSFTELGQDVLDLLVVTTANLFQGANVSEIEGMVRELRGKEEDGHHYFQEFLVFSDNLLHVFMRNQVNPDRIIVYVCRKKVNPGMALTKARMSQKYFAEAA